MSLSDFNRIFELCSKILSLGFTQIDLVNLSLIRIFVMSCYDLCLFSNSDTRISEKSDKANPWAVRLKQGVAFAQELFDNSGK